VVLTFPSLDDLEQEDLRLPARQGVLRSENVERRAHAAVAKRGGDGDGILTSAQSARKSVDNKGC